MIPHLSLLFALAWCSVLAFSCPHGTGDAVAGASLPREPGVPAVEAGEGLRRRAGATVAPGRGGRICACVQEVVGTFATSDFTTYSGIQASPKVAQTTASTRKAAKTFFMMAIRVDAVSQYYSLLFEMSVTSREKREELRAELALSVLMQPPASRQTTRTHMRSYRKN